MQLNKLDPKTKFRKRKRIGRGGKKGTYSGKGIKGQKSRAGRKLKPVIRELIKKYPKLRGYRFKTKSKTHGVNVVILNLSDLENKFNSKEKINPKILLEKKIIDTMKGRMPKIKILGQGKITKEFTIEDCSLSKSARDKIEKAGGKII